jgi:hypothetical protein
VYDTRTVRRSFVSIGLFLVLAAACSAGGEDLGEGTAAADAALVSQQITEIGFFWPSSPRTIHYTGERRYAGTRIDAPEGARIQLDAHIASGMKEPVVVIADEQLNVLAREVGGTISGAPGHSFARADLIAPKTGKYWVLWGENTKRRFDIEISYGVKRSAGVECHHPNMCVSENCGADHRCAKSTLTQYPSLCIVASDCTTDRCDGHLCQKRWNGDPCTDSAECMQNLCNEGICACVPDGQTADHPQKCCHFYMVGNTCADPSAPGGGGQ